MIDRLTGHSIRSKSAADMSPAAEPRESRRSMVLTLHTPPCRTPPDQLDKRPDKVFSRVLDRPFRRQERPDPLEVSFVDVLGHIPQEGVQLFLRTEVGA